MPKKISPEKKKDTLVILDAHAIIHRAYHALPSFSNSSGEPTGALYGVSTMLLGIIETFKPDYMVAAYDLPKPTFRHHVYDAYKAGRQKADEALVTQIERSKEVFAAFGVPVLSREGFEADDVIGTLAKKFSSPARRIVIASGDMDTLQLVEDEQVVVFTLRKGVQDTVLYDERAVRARFGFAPINLVDYKGLRGDPSDNIIGVPGIGEKTAQTLVGAFGTIEKMYEAIEKNDKKLAALRITPRILSILSEHKDEAFFSKTLATIRTDVPLEYELPETPYRTHVSEAALLSLLQTLEFRSLVPRVKKIFSFSESIAPVEAEDPVLLSKAAIALWVYRSDFTMADRDTILGQTKTNTLSEAHALLLSRLNAEGTYPVYEKIELPLLPLIRKMHERGIAIDASHFVSLKGEMTKKLEACEKEATTLIDRPINLGSPKQLSALLFEELKLAPKGKRKASGSFTTNAEALEDMKELHPIVPLILRYREIQKLLTTYVEPLMEAADSEGRVHADFYQNGTTTGRFSSSRPNLQNLPASGEGGKEIRRGFVAGPGQVFVSADYSQIELRVLAMLSGDEKLRQTFEAERDIHTSVATAVFSVRPEAVTSEMRRAAKVINFGIIYGMGVTALQKNLGTTRAEATLFYENYFAQFPTIKKYLDDTKTHAFEKGYTTTLFGRRRYLPTLQSTLPHIRAFAERMAGNAPLQGTAADIIKIAILCIENDLKKEGLAEHAALVLQVHDEVVYEVRKEDAEKVATLMKKSMESVLDRSPIPCTCTPVPLRVSVAIGERLDLLK